MAGEGSDGTVDADRHFNFPLKKDLYFGDVSLQVAAAVADGAMRNVLLGQDMTAAQLQVVVDDSSLQLSGPLTLGGVPLTAHWNESFAESPKVRSVVEAAIPRIDDAERSEEHTYELQSLMRSSYAVFCLKTKNNKHTQQNTTR